MEIYDTIDADQIEEGDQVLVNLDDPLEVSKVIDDGESVLIRGYSHLTGDNETYILGPKETVSLWRA